MNFLKKVFPVIFFIFLAFDSFAEQSQLQGNELCNHMYQYLENLELDVQKQEIVSSPQNDFPYNIILKFKNTTEDNNLIINVKTQEAWENRDLIFDLISDLRYRNFNSTIAFIYPRGQQFPGKRQIGGEQAFVNSLDSVKHNVALILNLSSTKNTVQTGSRIKTSPSWLISSTIDAYLKEKITSDLPVYYLSQMSKLGLSSDTIYNSYGLKDIPVITTDFCKEKINNRIIYRILSNFFDSYNNNKDRESDYHSLMIRLGKHKLWLSEYTIVKIWITITILSLIFVYIMAFINTSLRNSAWSQIKNNWYSIPVIYLFTVLGFFIAKVIYNLYTSKGSNAITIYGLPLLQLIFATVFVTLFFMLEITLHKKTYSERSVDFLIVLVTFVNQFLFCLSDISLFPLFMFLCFLSVLSLILKRNWFHILLFITMIGVYFPYILQLKASPQASFFKFYLIQNNSVIFFLSLILLPIYLMWFRILTAARKRFTETKIFLIINASTFICLMGTAVLINSFLFFDESRKNNQNQITPIYDTDKKAISAFWSDEQIFDDTLRTLKINLLQPSLCTTVTIKSEEGTPVLYSYYDYTQNQEKTASFSIPANPPSNLTFTYGTETLNSTIEIESIVKADGKNQFTAYKVILETGE